jgi:hypothetical protein
LQQPVSYKTIRSARREGFPPSCDAPGRDEACGRTPYEQAAVLELGLLHAGPDGSCQSRDPGNRAERHALPAPARGRAGRRQRPYEAWLETPKNLSGRALAEASGLVRLRNPEGTVTRWVEAADAPALLEEGWSRA